MGIPAYFKYITDNSSLPILIHEMPFISGLGGHTVNWPIELLNQLADFNNIQALINQNQPTIFRQVLYGWEPIIHIFDASIDDINSKVILYPLN